MRRSASPPTSNPPEPEGVRGPRPASRRPGLRRGAAMLLVPAVVLEHPAIEILNALWGHDQMSPSLWHALKRTTLTGWCAILAFVEDRGDIGSVVPRLTWPAAPPERMRLV